MLSYILGYLHIILGLAASLYFLWRNEVLDVFYILYFIGMNISWVLCKNECIVSYIFKRMNDPNYKMGENIKVDDYDYILGKTGSNIYTHYLLIMYVINLIVVICKGDVDILTKKLLLLGIFSNLVYLFSLRIELPTQYKDIIKYTHLGLNIGILVAIVNTYFPSK
jgi:hypothetical protein